MTEAAETPAKTDRGGSGRDARKYTDRDSQARGHRRSDGAAAQRKLSMFVGLTVCVDSDIRTETLNHFDRDARTRGGTFSNPAPS